MILKLRQAILPVLLLALFFCFSANTLKAQEVEVPLKDNHVQKTAFKQKWGAQKLLKKSQEDTIKLPFFDDFWYVGRKLDTNEVHPFEKHWLTRHTFINNTMAVSPPSIGVATFDGLAQNGRAYQEGSTNTKGIRSDTLLSRPINLAGYTNDTNVFLSFFYQPQGLGDAPEAEDSLILEFKAGDSSWVNLWSVPGEKFHYFKQIILQVKDPFLHSGFQFRFINRASPTGNLDSWHLDYVFLDKGRNINDTIHSDVALVYQPHSILKDYYAIPANQFRRIAPPQSAVTDQIIATVKNNYNQAQNVNFGYQVRYPNGSIFAPVSDPNLVIQQNVDPFSSDTLKIDLPNNDINTTNVTDEQFDLNVKYILRLGGQVSAHPENDTAELIQKFRNYYAYDDGTAEAGYGLKNSKAGKVAMKFYLYREDTLNGIAIHFNQSEEDVRFSTFSLIIWEEITPTEKIKARIDDLIPQYEDGFGYHYFRLENPVKLDGNKSFYVGWIQNREFLLNIGLDKNYNLLSNNKPNPNLFFNVDGSWQNSEVVGAPMIRPVFGREPYVSVKEEKINNIADQNFNPVIYPNPSNGILQLSLPSVEMVNIFLYDITGKLVNQQQQSGKDITLKYSGIKNGMYLIRIINKNGSKSSTQKIILE